MTIARNPLFQFKPDEIRNDRLGNIIGWKELTKQLSEEYHDLTGKELSSRQKSLLQAKQAELSRPYSSSSWGKNTERKIKSQLNLLNATPLTAPEQKFISELENRFKAFGERYNRNLSGDDLKLVEALSKTDNAQIMFGEDVVKQGGTIDQRVKNLVKEFGGDAVKKVFSLMSNQAFSSARRGESGQFMSLLGDVARRGDQAIFDVIEKSKPRLLQDIKELESNNMGPIMQGRIDLYKKILDVPNNIGILDDMGGFKRIDDQARQAQSNIVQQQRADQSRRGMEAQIARREGSLINSLNENQQIPGNQTFNNNQQVAGEGSLINSLNENQQTPGNQTFNNNQQVAGDAGNVIPATSLSSTTSIPQNQPVSGGRQFVSSGPSQPQGSGTSVSGNNAYNQQQIDTALASQPPGMANSIRRQLLSGDSAVAQGGMNRLFGNSTGFENYQAPAATPSNREVSLISSLSSESGGGISAPNTATGMSRNIPGFAGGNLTEIVKGTLEGAIPPEFAMEESSKVWEATRSLLEATAANAAAIEYNNAAAGGEILTKTSEEITNSFNRAIEAWDKQIADVKNAEKVSREIIEDQFAFEQGQSIDKRQRLERDLTIANERFLADQNAAIKAQQRAIQEKRVRDEVFAGLRGEFGSSASLENIDRAQVQGEGVLANLQRLKKDATVDFGNKLDDISKDYLNEVAAIGINSRKELDTLRNQSADRIRAITDNVAMSDIEKSKAIGDINKNFIDLYTAANRANADRITQINITKAGLISTLLSYEADEKQRQFQNNLTLAQFNRSGGGGGGSGGGGSRAAAQSAKEAEIRRLMGGLTTSETRKVPLAGPPKPYSNPMGFNQPKVLVPLRDRTETIQIPVSETQLAGWIDNMTNLEYTENPPATAYEAARQAGVPESSIPQVLRIRDLILN